MNLEDLIENVLISIDYEPNIDFESYESHYLLFNPLTNDSGSKSAVIFKCDGNLRMYDTSILIKRGEEEINDTVLTLTEWLRKVNRFDFYIMHIVAKLGIRRSVFEEYKEAVKSLVFFKTWGDYPKRVIKNFDEIRKGFFKSYITDYDIIKSDDVKRDYDKIKKLKNENPIKKQKSDLLISDPSSLERLIAENYINSRKIERNINIEIKTIGYSGGKYRYPSVCFNYPSGFRKFRIINAKNRYLANTDNGKYENLFEARVNKTNKCYIVEGEFDALSILNFTDCDVYAMHNVNSLPANLNQLNGYKDIVVKVDFDKFEDVKNKLYLDLSNYFKNKNISVEYKIKTNDKSIDYNSLLISKGGVLL